MTPPVTVSSSPGRQVVGPWGMQSTPPELVPTREPAGSLLTSLVTEILRGSTGAASGVLSSKVRSSGAHMVAHPETANIVASSGTTGRRSRAIVVRQRISSKQRTVKRLASQGGAERMLQRGIAKGVATGLESRRQHALARQQELIRHLTQREASRERGQGHQGRAAEHPPEGAIG